MRENLGDLHLDGDVAFRASPYRTKSLENQISHYGQVPIPTPPKKPNKSSLPVVPATVLRPTAFPSLLDLLYKNITNCPGCGHIIQEAEAPRARRTARGAIFVFEESVLKEEKLGWRDERISQRHRFWGICPAADLDFPLLEYYNSKPAALIEYKHRGFRIDLDHPSLRAIATLASNSRIPAWVAEYNPESWTVKLHELNVEALEYMEAHRETFRRMTEEQYVTFLHDLRGIGVPQDVRDRLREIRMKAGRDAPSQWL